MTVLQLIISAVVIVAAAALFTNAVEILGDRLNLGQGAVGSVLAAVGTALPETMIPFVAIIAILLGGGSAASSDIGVGAILGAPFLLATLALFVAGVSILAFRRRRQTDDDLVVDRETARRDMLFFLICFGLGAGAGLVPLPSVVKVILAVGLVLAYGLHVRQTLKFGGDAIEDPPGSLTLWPSGSPAPTWAVAAQVLGTVGIMGVGAHFFVTAVEHFSESAGIPAGLIALVLAPLATELPEKFNSVIWLRGNKDTLALGNITGAMVFQSTIPVALGLAFTPWNLDLLTAFSVALALIGGGYLYALLFLEKPIEGEYLLVGGALYAAFVIAALVTIL
jgi:cation:H+ antiporter